MFPQNSFVDELGSFYPGVMFPQNSFVDELGPSTLVLCVSKTRSFLDRGFPGCSVVHVEKNRSLPIWRGGGGLFVGHL